MDAFFRSIRLTGIREGVGDSVVFDGCREREEEAECGGSFDDRGGVSCLALNSEAPWRHMSDWWWTCMSFCEH